MARNYNEAIKEAIESFLIDEDWKYEFLDDIGAFRMNVGLDSKVKSARVYIDVLDWAFKVLCVPPIAADDGSIDVTAEFLTRVNYSMNIGNFEMDYSDGEIRYKTAVLCSDTVPTYSQVKDAIYLNIITLERYCDALTMVLYGMITPEAAIKLLEG